MLNGWKACPRGTESDLRVYNLNNEMGRKWYSDLLCTISKWPLCFDKEVYTLYDMHGFYRSLWDYNKRKRIWEVTAGYDMFQDAWEFDVITREKRKGTYMDPLCVYTTCFRYYLLRCDNKQIPVYSVDIDYKPKYRYGPHEPPSPVAIHAYLPEREMLRLFKCFTEGEFTYDA